MRMRIATALVVSSSCLAVPRASAQAVPTDAADARPLAVAMTRLLGAARGSDPRLTTLRALVEAAAARSRAVGLAPPLALSASASDGPQADLLAGNLGVEVGRELFLGARSAAARTRAQVDVDAAQAELDAAERLLEMRVLTALAQVAGATRIADRLDRSDRWLADAESALGARLAVGEARYVDVLRVRTERLQAVAERSRMLADRAASLEALRVMVGDAISEDSLRRLVDGAGTDAALAEWRAALDDGPLEALLVAGFPAVRSAIAGEAAARAERGVVAAGLRPSVTGAAGLQRIGPANGGSTLGLVLGFSTTLPFTAATARERTLAAADATTDAARAGRAAATARARATVRAARVRYDASRTRVDAFDAALLVAADAEREAALGEYRSGTLSLLELLDFERALVRVEVERTRALLDAVQARGALLGLESPDIGVVP